MKINNNNGIFYNGLRFYDDTKNIMYYFDWVKQENEEWTPLQQIPEGSRIFGLKADTKSQPLYFTGLIFLLAGRNDRGQTEFTGELRFPPVKVFIQEVFVAEE